MKLIEEQECSCEKGEGMLSMDTAPREGLEEGVRPMSSTQERKRSDGEIV